MNTFDQTVGNKTHANALAQATSYIQLLGENAEASGVQAQKVRQQEDLYKRVFDSVSDAIFIVNSEGNVAEQNRVARALFPQRNGVASRTISEIFCGEDSFKFSLTVDRCVRLSSESSFTASHLDQLGAEKVFKVNVRPIQVDSKNGALIVIKDITKKLMNERTLRQAKLRAESSDLAKTQFLANISHEVRTPMNIIMGYAGLMADSKLSQKEREEFSDKILNSGKSLMSLLDKALQVSSGGTEIGSIRKSEFKLFPAIKSFMKNWSSESIDINLDFRMPLNQKVHTDQERLLQALSNLMDNALKFTKRGSVELIVEEFNGRASFCVADTGIGVARDQWKRLFNPFTQADESFTRDFGGSGLGLAVVKHLASALGGGARVKQSEVGSGSVFEFWLDSALVKGPLVEKEDRSESKAEQRPAYPNLSHAKILLVEDVEENRFLIKRYLKEIKCHVDTAYDGKDALTKLKDKNYDLILMDLQMPRLDGYGATELIRKSGLKVPIIALTAHNLTKDIEKCRRAGFTGHLSKPVAQAQLLSKVHRTLEQSLR